MQLLYKNIIDNDGKPGNLEVLMYKFNEEAKKRVEDYEILQRRMEEAAKKKKLEKMAMFGAAAANMDEMEQK